ncbi:ABC transporter permease [Catenulispora pinisilvae]|uniref:ABC transporter permease n=1 Tax=Catenulispora pinisilvae TaxID=2705253 RepID=UPI00189276F2|nr:ABC-2 family transporter protein [Catenulispora pinisilvae]
MAEQPFERRFEQRTPGAVATYLYTARMWGRSAMQYRASLVLVMVNSLFMGSLELFGILVVFGNVSSIGGFSLPEALYLYGTAQAAFFTSDLLFTGTEYLAVRIRMGTFDSLLIRPVGVLPQVFADQFTPRRLTPMIPAFAALVVGLAKAPVHWTLLRAAMVPYTLLVGVVVFGAVWVLVGAFQIVAADASEVMNSVTYGGQFMTSYPLALYGRNLMLFLTFGLPMAYVNWQPTLYVLNHADPLGTPSFFRFAGPLFAAALWGVALLAWRAALRHHRSTGS